MMQRGRAAPERARGSRGRGDGGTTVLVGHRGRRGIRPGARAVRRVGLAAPAASGGLFPRLARLALAGDRRGAARLEHLLEDRKSTRLNSSHQIISYAVFCLKKKKHQYIYNK